MPRQPPDPAPRCTFVEGRRRCRRNGFGQAQLCRVHMLVMRDAAESAEQQTQAWGAKAADVVGKILAGKRVSNRDVVRGMADLIGALGQVPMPPRAQQAPQPQQAPPWGPWTPPPRPPPRPRQPPRPPPPPAPPPLDNVSRQVMGFAGNQLLTREQILDRRRELAKRHHPDRGGKLETMQRINGACDALLAELDGPAVRSRNA